MKGGCEGLGVSTLMRDLGESPEIRMHIDANAAKGIIERRGLQKLRHIDLDVLWLQELKARRQIPADKVLGIDNVADLMTKHVTSVVINKSIYMINLYLAERRSLIAHNLHSVSARVATSYVESN